VRRSLNKSVIARRPLYSEEAWLLTKSGPVGQLKKDR
jgi:hypothetical protein